MYRGPLAHRAVAGRSHRHALPSAIVCMVRVAAALASLAPLPMGGSVTAIAVRAHAIVDGASSRPMMRVTITPTGDEQQVTTIVQESGRDAETRSPVNRLGGTQSPPVMAGPQGPATAERPSPEVGIAGPAECTAGVSLKSGGMAWICGAPERHEVRSPSHV